MNSSLNETLSLIAAHLNAKFYLNERFLTYGEVFSDQGLLPALMKRAEQLSFLCMGYGLGASYEDSQDGLLGTKVILDDVTPQSLRLVCLLDVLSELIQGGPSQDHTPLDELLYD
jgi:intracellular multiplication protein IcmS